MVDYIVDTNPGDLLTNLKNVSKHIQEQYDPIHELNKYRKSFGNLNDCIKKPGTAAVFEMQGTAFKFKHHTKV